MRSAPPEFHGSAPGNVARLNLPAGPAGELRACVVCAVYLVTEGEHRAGRNGRLAAARFELTPRSPSRRNDAPGRGQVTRGMVGWRAVRFSASWKF